MLGSENPLSPEELLSHIGWMRSLARSLAVDESRAEDLVQDTLAAALERPPRSAGAARAWLRVVLSNFFRRSRKEDSRRLRRERIASRPEPCAAGSLEVLEQAELQRRLVDLVFELEEPFRSTVLLRYFEDLKPAEIAERLGVEVTTVRWRLRQTHERLRERLDRSYGRRGAWVVLALALPTTSTRAAAAFTIVAGPSIPWRLFGVILMKVKVTAFLVALALFLVGSICIFRLSNGPGPAAKSPSPTSTESNLAKVSAAKSLERQGPDSPAEAPAAGKALAPTEPPGPAIKGVVIDAETGEPIARALVQVRKSEAKAETDEEGAYRLAALAPGEHFIVAMAEGHAERHARVRLGDSVFRADFRLDPAIELQVTVKDEEGKPIAGVEVTPAQPSGDYVHGPGYSRETDERGETSIPGISRLLAQQINARKEGYHEVWTESHRLGYGKVVPELAIVLRARKLEERWVQGEVTSADGRALAGVQVQWIHSHGESKGRVVTTTDAAGSYRLSFPSDDRPCRISAFLEAWAPQIREGIHPGTAEEPGRCDFVLEGGHWLEGTVVDEKGEAVVGAIVKAMPNLGYLRNPTLYPGILREARTDTHGAFRLGSLAGPEVALKVAGPPESGTWGNNMHPKVSVDQRLKLVLRRFGVVQGRVVDAETREPVRSLKLKLKKGVGYYDYARCDPGEFFDSPEGRFALRELDQEPTTFTVEAEGYLPTRVTDALPAPEPDAEEMEVALTRGQEIEGVVLDAATGAPVTGAEIVFGVWEWPDPPGWNEYNLTRLLCRQQLATGADGAFRLLESDPGVIFVKAMSYARMIVVPESRERLADRTGRLRIRLPRPGSVSGVHRRAGNPCASGWLALFELREPKKPGEEAPKVWIGNLDRDVDGKFRRENLTPGRYLLELFPDKKEGQKAEKRENLRLEVEIPSGRETVVDVEEPGEEKRIAPAAE